jgi:hypothetical protein
MSVILDGILGKDKVYAGHSPAINLAIGGQSGHFNQVGIMGADGRLYDGWVSNAAYVKRNVIPILLRSPSFFKLMPEPDKWTATLKTLMENRALAITGLTSGLTVETSEHAVGGDGNMQEEVTNVTRARSNPNYTWQEMAGKAICKFFDKYIRYGMMDPDTKKVLDAMYITDINSQMSGMYTPDWYSFSMMFIEPDITQKLVVDAWMCVNMFPKSNGDRTGGRDLRQAGETPEVSIDFAAITLNNEAVLLFADKILASLTVLNKLPDTEIKPTQSEIDSNVSASQAGFNSVR